MQPAIGTMQEFSPDSESITAYLERLQLFFDCNGIAERKRVATLLTVIGHKTFSLLRNLLAPAELKDQMLETLTTTLKRHFEPRSLVIAEHFYFNRRNQLPGESVADFIAELRRLASTCQFETFLSDALCDRFVCGLRSEVVQRKLIAEENLELAKAVDIAQKLESAEKNTKPLF